MEPKKNPRVDVNKKRFVFFQVGIIVSIGLVFAAFQYKTEQNIIDGFDQEMLATLDFELPPVTRREDPKPPEPPKPKQTVDLDIVKNDEIIKKEAVVATSEDNPDTKVVTIPFEELVDDIEEDLIFMIVEEMPEYPGGDGALLKDIMQNIEYPEIAKENGIQGRVFVEFIVNKRGDVENVTVVRGVDPSLDNEALRVVKGLKKWVSGKQRGKNVSVTFTVPINFRLN